MSDSARGFFAALAGRGFEPQLRGVNGTYGFEVEGAGDWHIAVDDGRVTVTEGRKPADCTVAISEDDLVRASRGERNLLTRALQGCVEVRGDMRLAQALNSMLRTQGAATTREEHPHG